MALVVDGTMENIKRVSLSIQGSISFNWPAKSGKRVIELVVDPSDEIPEVNKENNRAEMRLSVPYTDLRWMFVALVLIFSAILVLIWLELRAER